MVPLSMYIEPVVARPNGTEAVRRAFFHGEHSGPNCFFAVEVLGFDSLAAFGHKAEHNGISWNHFKQERSISFSVFSLSYQVCS